MTTAQRKLAAVLSADVVGFSRLMEADDEATLGSLKQCRAAFAASIHRHGGRLLDATGDALLADFPSAIRAVDCALAVQRQLAALNRPRAPECRMEFRIAVNLGDVIEENGCLFGDGVNVAARLQALASPGEIFVSAKVFDEVDGRVDASFEFAGERQVKNIAKSIGIYRVLPRPRLRLNLLGEMQLTGEDAERPLPPSKKTRALLAYLAMTGAAHRRERLCSLFWDVADDPRAALRWSLSRLRPLIDSDAARRLVAERDTIALDVAGLDVDVLLLRDRLAAGVDHLTTDELVELAREIRGEFLEGLNLTDFDDFYAWCVAQREEVRRWHTQILKTLIERLQEQPEGALPHARTLIQIDPFSLAARVSLLRLLLATRREAEAEQQYQAGERLLRQLGTGDSAKLAKIWQELRTLPASPAPATSPVVRAPRRAGQETPTGLEAAAFPTAILPALIGRQTERDRLLTLVSEVEQARCARVVLLTGEPGVGKSRLLSEVVTHVSQSGGTALYGAAYEIERSHPYGPWIDALRRLPAAQIGNSIALDLAPLLPQVARASESELSRDRLFGAVVELIAARAHSAAPVVLVLDDVHWCDEASIELLHYVIRMNRHRPLLVALAVRPGDLPDNVPAQRVLRQLRREQMVQELALGPLTQPDAAALVHAIAPQADAARLVAESAGNPLFLVELARASSQRQGDLPLTLSEVIRDRVERLLPPAGDVVRWAAVVGPTFDLAQLRALAEIAEGDLLSAVENLERHGLITPARDGKQAPAYAFAHEVLRRVVYSDLSEPRRRLMHERIARQLEAAGELDEAAVGDIAHHASLAGQAGLAARACLAAGQRCLRVFANTEAHAFARRGMHYAEQLREPERVTLSLDLLNVSYTARRPARLDEAAQVLERLAEQALDHSCFEHARLGFHMVGHLRWEGGQSSDAQRQLLRAEVVTRSADERQHIVAMAEAARCLVILERDLGNAESMLLEARALAHRLGIEPVAIPKGIGMLRLQQGQLAEAAALLEHAQLLARRDGDHLTEYQALETLIMLELQREDYLRARTLCGELEIIAGKLREGSEAPFAGVLSDLIGHGEGMAEAPQALAESLVELRTADAKYRLAFALNRAAAFDHRRGDYRLALERAEEALQLARVLEHSTEIVLAHVVAARAAAALGDEQRARHYRAALGKALSPLASALARREAEKLLAGDERRPARTSRRR